MYVALRFLDLYLGCNHDDVPSSDCVKFYPLIVNDNSGDISSQIHQYKLTSIRYINGWRYHTSPLQNHLIPSMIDFLLIEALLSGYL